MRTQVEKGHLFQELHQRRGILILPNPWDAGTAKLLASLFRGAGDHQPRHVQRARPRRRRARSAAPLRRTAASSRRRPTCRSTPTLKTVTPMIPSKLTIRDAAEMVLLVLYPGLERRARL